MDVQEEQIGKGQSRTQLSNNYRIFHIFLCSLCTRIFLLLLKFSSPSSQSMKPYANNVPDWSPTGSFSHYATEKMPTDTILFLHSSSSCSAFISMSSWEGDEKLNFVHFGEHEVLILDHMCSQGECPLDVKASFDEVLRDMV